MQSFERYFYDKLSFIDTDGYERIVIKNTDTDAYILPDEELQNKKDRYYFQDIMKIDNGEMALLNSDGYWLFSINTELEWLFMLENQNDVAFGNLYPMECREILKGKTQFLSENGLFTKERIKDDELIMLAEKKFMKKRIL